MSQHLLSVAGFPLRCDPRVFDLIVCAFDLVAQYFTVKEEDDEDMWGDRAILQRRYPPEDELEDYFEARAEARQIKKFFRSGRHHERLSP